MQLSYSSTFVDNNKCIYGKLELTIIRQTCGPNIQH